MIEIRTMRLSRLQDKGELLLAEADEERRKRAMRFVHREDMLRCLAAGYLLKHFVPGYSGDRLIIGKDGKPFLKEGLPFSISHGGDYILLAWLDGSGGIGADVEPLGHMDLYRPILPYSMSEAEIRFVGDDPANALRIWTRKESLYKSVGTGVKDILELPEVLEDEVEFLGRRVHLTSYIEDAHVFSIACHGYDGIRELAINHITI